MKNFYYCEFVFGFFAFMYLFILSAILNMDIVLVINTLCLSLQEDGLFKPKLSA
jgi:hypothetical protein